MWRRKVWRVGMQLAGKTKVIHLSEHDCLHVLSSTAASVNPGSWMFGKTVVRHLQEFKGSFTKEAWTHSTLMTRERSCTRSGKKLSLFQQKPEGRYIKRTDDKLLLICNLLGFLITTTMLTPLTSGKHCNHDNINKVVCFNPNPEVCAKVWPNL